MTEFRKGGKFFFAALPWLGWSALALVPFLGENFPAFRVLAEAGAALGVALLFWVVALGTGWRCLKLSGAFAASPENPGARLSRIMLSCGAGLGILAAWMLVIGTFIGVTIPVLFAGMVVLIALVGPVWLDLIREFQQVLQLLRTRRWMPLEILGVLLIIGIACLQLPAALTPTLYPDTWRYHFGLTRLFEQAGKISILPDFAEANIASNWQMIDLPILMLSGDAVAQVFNWMTLPLTALVVALAARPHRWLVASLTLITTPFLLEVAGLGNNDLGVAFFAALMWLALGTRNVEHGIRNPECLLAGIFGGLAVGTKYPAAIAVLAVMIAMIAFSKNREKSRGRDLGLFLGGAFLGYLPWFARNGFCTGDPFYPILSNWLPWCGPEGRWVSEHYARELATYGAEGGWLKGLVLAPWRVTIADHHYFESDIGMVYWCMVPAILWAVWRQPQTRMIIGAALLGGIMWTLGAQVPRFLAPLLPVMALAVSEGWGEWTADGRRLKVRWIWIPLIVVNLWQALTAVAGFSDPYHFLLQGMTRDEYLSRHSHLYRMAQWANKHYPDRRILLFGEEGVFVFQNPVKVSGPFNQKWLVQQVTSSKSPKDLTRRLREADISLLCINELQAEGFDRRFGYSSWPSEPIRRRFQSYLAGEAILAHEEGPIRLYFAGFPDSNRKP